VHFSGLDEQGDAKGAGPGQPSDPGGEEHVPEIATRKATKVAALL